MTLTRKEVEEIAELTAKEAVKQTLAGMGFDPDASQESQADMAYLRSQRRTSEKIGLALKIAMWTTLMTGGLSMVWVGVQTALKVSK